MKMYDFNGGWAVFQDHYDLGESYAIYEDKFDNELMACHLPAGANFQPDEWRTIPMLGHLQTLFSDDPYYAAEMRLYNIAPWWYRKTFDLSEKEAGQNGYIRFEGVDYYCKVWLNGTLLGEHEGYTTAFEYEVGGLLKEHNVVYVKVSSPLDFERASDDEKDPRFLNVVRHMMKGTYEHGDSLIHRNMNPVGIWRPVRLSLYDEMRLVGSPRVDASVKPDGSARVNVEWTVRNAGQDAEKSYHLSVISRQSDFSKSVESAIVMKNGDTVCLTSFDMEKPELWDTWDQGQANLYDLELRVKGLDMAKVRFGIRSVELVRTKEDTYFVINGQKQFVRGTCYFPETYLSTMTWGRYRRDLETLKQMGCNMLRIHVHQEKPEFYALCDEMGIAVMQDTDFNWVHPIDDEWTKRALKIVEDQEISLHNHPSVVSWICLNEPVGVHLPHMGRYSPENEFVYKQPGPQLYKLLSEKSAGCGIIRASFCENDLLSGDSHNYIGSIDGPDENYTAVDNSTAKFSTEFGFDAPPEPERLWRNRKVFDRMNPTAEKLEELQTYQYLYLKYFIEHYRLRKYAPTSGYMSFMLVDCSPGTFYGVLDHDGCAKKGIRAFLESSQPIALIMKQESDGQDVYIVNDYHKELRGHKLHWRAANAAGDIISQGSREVSVASDGIEKCASLDLNGQDEVYLDIWLSDGAGNVAARNRYEDPFHPMAHPANHPRHFSFSLGIRLY